MSPGARLDVLLSSAEQTGLRITGVGTQPAPYFQIRRGDGSPFITAQNPQAAGKFPGEQSGELEIAARVTGVRAGIQNDYLDFNDDKKMVAALLGIHATGDDGVYGGDDDVVAGGLHLVSLEDADVHGVAVGVGGLAWGAPNTVFISAGAFLQAQGRAQNSIGAYIQGIPQADSDITAGAFIALGGEGAEDNVRFFSHI